MDQKYNIQFVEVVGDIFLNVKKIKLEDIEKKKTIYKTTPSSYNNYPIYDKKPPLIIKNKSFKYNSFILVEKNRNNLSFTFDNNEDLFLMLNKHEALGIFTNYIYSDSGKQSSLDKKYKTGFFEVTQKENCNKEEVIEISQDRIHRSSITFLKMAEEGIPIINLKQNQIITTYAENISAFELNTNFVAGMSLSCKGFRIISTNKKKNFRIHLCDRYRFIRIENKKKTIIITGKK
jgi:hypothetical protein